MFKSKLSRNALLLTGLALVMGFGTAAAAGQAGDSEAARDSGQLVAQSTEQQNVEFGDDKLAAFVDARESVVQISQQWEERLNNAESQEKLNSLQQEAQQEMVEAVREEGLTVNEYNMIVDATQTDPELRERVNEMMTQ